MSDQPSNTSILPEFFGNGIKSLNALSRTVLIACESSERVVIEIDKIAAIQLAKTRDAMLANIAPPPVVTE